MDIGIPLLNIKLIMLESNRLKSRIVIQVLFYRLSFLIRQIIRKEHKFN